MKKNIIVSVKTNIDFIVSCLCVIGYWFILLGLDEELDFYYDDRIISYIIVAVTGAVMIKIRNIIVDYINKKYFTEKKKEEA